jgi:putative transposase
VEELLFARGISVTYEAIRQWCRKFGQAYANQLRHRRPQPGDKWHLDEIFLTINGARQYLWHAVDQEGNMLDILVQPWINDQWRVCFVWHKDGAYQVEITDYH